MAPPTEIFVGRSSELAALSALLEQVCAGHGRLALIAGEPGIGKTRTAQELIGHAERLNARMVWGHCHEEAGAPPYWPWAQILRAVAEPCAADQLILDLDAGATDIADIVPDIRARLPDLEPPFPLSDPSEMRFRLFGSVTRFLINVSNRQPLVLLLDDIHWADVPSLRLLEFLAREMADSRLLVVCTYRETEVSRRHRLSDTLGALARVPRMLRLHLTGLNAAEVRDFVASATGVTPIEALTAAIHAQTEGNPLFVREVVRFLAQQGGFTGNPPSALRLPEGVREVIGRRLNLVSASCNEVLAVAAVIGRHFSHGVLARACLPRPEDVVLEALDEAQSAHIIEETEPEQYQFTHALIRVTLYDELRAGQRRRLHHAAGEAIETTHRRDPSQVLADLAYHFRMSGLSGDVERAIDYAIRSGRAADAALAYEDAAGFFQNALDMEEDLGKDDPGARGALLFQLGESRRKAADFGSAMETLQEAAILARDNGRPVLLAQAALSHANVSWRHRSFGEWYALTDSSLLREALRYLPETERGMRIKVMALLARERLHHGAVDEARRLAEEAVVMARRLGDPGVLALAWSAVSDFPWEPHETEARLATAVEMTVLAEQAGDLETASAGYTRQVGFALELGDVPAANEAIERHDRNYPRLRQKVFPIITIGLRATLALVQGSLREAEQFILQVIRINNATAVIQVSDAVSLLIFDLRREQGRLRDLAPLVSAFARDKPAETWRPGLALLYVELGDNEAARAVFNELVADDFASLPRDGRWTTCLVYLSEVCVALRDATRAAALYRLLLPWSERFIVAGGGTGCWGSAGRFLGMLAALMENWQAAERHFQAALALNERAEAWAPLAHTQFDYAVMLLARGETEAAAAHLRAAKERADALGLTALAARFAGLDARPASGAPDNLTARELEVLHLMAIGRGNADIALALGISQNTAARHVHNILTKTGCANRTEAAAYAMRNGLDRVV